MAQGALVRAKKRPLEKRACNALRYEDETQIWKCKLHHRTKRK